MKRIYEIQLQEKQVSIYANAQAPVFFSAENKAHARFDNEAILNARRAEKIREWRERKQEEKEELVAKSCFSCF